jgi:hypothetical protein
MAAAMYVTANFTSPTVPFHAVVFLTASASLIAAGRAADRLWDGMVLPVVRFTTPRLCIVSRLPFRFLAGGIAFTTVLLTAKKTGMAPVRDIPVMDLFMTGGIMSLCYYGFLEGFRGVRTRASRRRAGHSKGETHDKD